MKNILAFAGSNSSSSINQKLTEFVASQLKEHQARVLSLIHYAVPIYSEDIENKDGVPGMILALHKEISEADALIIAVNEHNGGWSAFFKNIIDWLSRLDRNFLENKKILLISTSPGQRGGRSALEFGKNILPRFGGKVIENFSFPSFYANFSAEENTVVDEMLLMGLQEVLDTFENEIK